MPADIHSVLRRAAAAVAGATVVAGPLLVTNRATLAPTAPRTAAVALERQAATRFAVPLLKLESHGRWVKWVQRRLRIRADGIFGRQTRSAVIRFQQRHRLEADGVVGPRTIAALRTQPRRTRSCVIGGAVYFSNDWGEPRAGGRRHKGIDVFAPYGAPVLAIGPGRVARSYTSGLGGRQIVLRVGRVHYYYAHQSKNLVRAGQRVWAGQLIGRVGTSGNARGGPPHVHFTRWEGPLANHRQVSPYRILRSVC